MAYKILPILNCVLQGHMVYKIHPTLFVENKDVDYKKIFSPNIAYKLYYKKGRPVEETKTSN